MNYPNQKEKLTAHIMIIVVVTLTLITICLLALIGIMNPAAFVS